MFLEKKAIIIGGSKGIGKALALKLSTEVKELVITFSKQTDEVLQLILQLKKNCKNVKAICCDLNKNWDCVLEDLKTCDVLCICTGPFLQKELHNTNVEQWNKIVKLNYLLPGIFISTALNNMKDKRFGRILVFGGTATDNLRGFRTNPVYGSAKIALCSLVKSVAMEYSQFGITCNGILPGQIAGEELADDLYLEYQKKMPQGLISVEEILSSCMFLLKSDKISGELLRVDGGWQP